MAMLAASAFAAAAFSIFLREDIRKQRQEQLVNNRLSMNRASIGALIIEGARLSVGPRESRPDLDSPAF